jgi:hypothetical protein
MNPVPMTAAPMSAILVIPRSPPVRCGKDV